MLAGIYHDRGGSPWPYDRHYNTPKMLSLVTQMRCMHAIWQGLRNIRFVRKCSAVQSEFLAVSSRPAARGVLMWQIAQSAGKEQP